MRKFIVTAYKQNAKCFFIESDEPGIKFYCEGLKDLYNTIRCLTPRGYRVNSAQWFGREMKYFKGIAPMEMIGTLLKIKMFEIDELLNNHKPIQIMKSVDHTNSFGFTANLKLVEQEPTSTKTQSIKKSEN